MNEINLDGKMMINPRITHLYLRYNLNLPKSYGHNLDALFDHLSTWDNQTLIILKNKEAMLENLHDYGEKLLETIEDSALDNPNIKFMIRS